MNWLTIVDAAARVAKISGGKAEAQIADNIPYANIDQLKKPGLTVEGGKGMNHMFLMFNTATKPFDDVRVRQALHYAIDTQKMIEVALKGHGNAVHVLPQRGATRPTREASTVYDYDPDKAKALLKEAGVDEPDDQPDAVNVSWIVDCLPTIAASWDAIGVKTTLEPQDTSRACSPRWTSCQDYQVVAAASNPNQFGTRRRPDHALQLRARAAWDEVHQVGRAAPRPRSCSRDGRGHRGAGPGEEAQADPGVPGRGRRAGRALPGRAHRADDRLGPEEARPGVRAQAVPGHQRAPGQARPDTARWPSSSRMLVLPAARDPDPGPAAARRHRVRLHRHAVLATTIRRTRTSRAPTRPRSSCTSSGRRTACWIRCRCATSASSATCSSGDMGTSVLTKAPVLDSVTTALPLTLPAHRCWAWLIAHRPVAAASASPAAIFRDRWPDQVIRVVSLAGVAAPSFWLALLMIQYLAVGPGPVPDRRLHQPGRLLHRLAELR